MIENSERHLEVWRLGDVLIDVLAGCTDNLGNAQRRVTAKKLQRSY
jgi:hypothetical protein